MKTRSQVYLIGALFFVLIIAWNVCGVDAEVKESQSTEIQAPEQTGPDGSVANWLERAETSADYGHADYMEVYFIRAKWCVEDLDIPEEIKTAMLKNISERAKIIGLKGHMKAASNEMTKALYCAYVGYESQVEDHLKKFIAYSLKARMEPNGKIKKIREILTTTLAERKKLSEN